MPGLFRLPKPNRRWSYCKRCGKVIGRHHRCCRVERMQANYETSLQTAEEAHVRDGSQRDRLIFQAGFSSGWRACARETE